MGILNSYWAGLLKRSGPVKGILKLVGILKYEMTILSNIVIKATEVL